VEGLQGQPSRAVTSASAAPTSASPDELPAIRSLDGSPTATEITEIGQPDWLAIAGDSVWAAGVPPGIGRFTLASGRQRAGVVAGAICLAMDVGFDSLWAGDCRARALLRIDPKSGEITATIPLPGTPLEETSVAAGEGSVWVTVDRPPRLVRIDPKTNRVTTTTDVPALAGALRAGLGGLWFASASGKLIRLDPQTGDRVAEIQAGKVPRFTAVGGGSVWVLNQADGTVSRIDPRTNTVVATITVSAQPVEGGDMAFGGGYAWARVSDALVAQIDPDTNKVIRRFGEPEGSGSVVADDNAVWISAHDVETIWRVALR
jgi:YVTN family beta-propeller protein